MYNFTVPSQLKAWIDRIPVAGKTFHYGDNGPKGLVRDKRVIVALSRGGFYGEGAPAAPLEHLETYLRGLFNFIGIKPEFVSADGLAVGPDIAKPSLKQAPDQILFARRLTRSLGCRPTPHSCRHPRPAPASPRR